MKKFIKLLLGLSCGLSLMGSTSVALAKEKPLYWSEVAEIQTLDPAASVDTTSSEMIHNCYEGLYRIVGNGNVKKALVTGEKLSQDGLTYTFKLRRNAKWSNGDKVTAKDFVYSWRRALDPKTKAGDSQLFEGIKNASAVATGKVAPSELGVYAVDDHTLKVQLERKIPYFKLLTITSIFSPLDQKAVEKYGDKYGTSAETTVYNGPFVLQDWSGTNQKWRLQKNAKYWDKQHVKLKEAEFLVTKSPTTAYNMFQRNQLDKANLDQTQAKQLHASPDFVARKQNRINYLEINKTDPDFANVDIRQALSYAIDRKQLVDSILDDGSTQTRSVVPKEAMTYKRKDFSTVAATKVGTTYDPKLAKLHLKKGLKALGKDSLEFTLLTDDDDLSKRLGEYFQSQLEEHLPNVKVKVMGINKKTRIARMQSGDFEVTLTGYSADYQDATAFLNLFSPDSPFNFGKWDNKEYAKLLDEAKEQSGQKRFGTLVKASKLLSKDQAVVPLYRPAIATVLKNDVKGVTYNSVGIYLFRDVTLK